MDAKHFNSGVIINNRKANQPKNYKNIVRKIIIKVRKNNLAAKD